MTTENNDISGDANRHKGLMLSGAAVVVAGVGRIAGYPLESGLIGLPLFLAGCWYANKTISA